jgi:hypothetical protein
VARTLEERAYELTGRDEIDRLRKDIGDRTIDPYEAAERIISSL